MQEENKLDPTISQPKHTKSQDPTNNRPGNSLDKSSGQANVNVTNRHHSSQDPWSGFGQNTEYGLGPFQYRLKIPKEDRNKIPHLQPTSRAISQNIHQGSPKINHGARKNRRTQRTRLRSH